MKQKKPYRQPIPPAYMERFSAMFADFRPDKLHNTLEEILDKKRAADFCKAVVSGDATAIAQALNNAAQSKVENEHHHITWLIVCAGLARAGHLDALIAVQDRFSPFGFDVTKAHRFFVLERAAAQAPDHMMEFLLPHSGDDLITVMYGLLFSGQPPVSTTLKFIAATNALRPEALSWVAAQKWLLSMRGSANSRHRQFAELNEKVDQVIAAIDAHLISQSLALDTSAAAQKPRVPKKF